MSFQVTLNDNSAVIQTQMDGNKRAVLTAMGLKAVQLTVERMENGYGRPIRQTGNLMRDVSSEVENSAPDTVDVGSGLNYATFVHEGTYKMAARPYLRDALNGGASELKEVAESYLKQGF